VIVNNDFFESLPPEIQEGLQRAAKEAAVQNMEWMRGYEKDIYGHFEEAGLKINTLDLTPFSEAVKPVWEKYAERVGQERIDRVVELQAACEQS
jgi:TRAP-type C4-dicarboxylate transport system substrate-binding protein